MTEIEAADLRSKARAACMTESRLMRMLLEGYNPPPVPDDKFYEAMEEMRVASSRLKEAARIAKSPVESDELSRAARDLLRIQRDLERKYLMPKESDFKWQ